MNVRILAITTLTVALAACGSMGSPYRDSYSDHGDYRSETRCYDCGVVQRIERYDSDGRTSGGGAVAGAVIGGVLGNQIGKGDGRKAATVVGAVAGGFAGNAIERDSSRTRYAIDVRMDNGQRISVHQSQLNGVREGSRVVVRDGVARLY